MPQVALPSQKSYPLTHACPVCGGLECLCRPRFFAGQLLTEEDLRALDHYIIEKNKLHNRYLHGSGVVCGLQVLCHECKGWVTIKSGYALDPCGNDIIVCEDYSFDLCAKIKECCDRKRNQWECEPMGTPAPDCKDLEQCWYVTLRYNEFDSRGITALKSTNQPACCPRCGCTEASCGCSGTSCGCSDAGSDCSCSCHHRGGHSYSKKASPRHGARRPMPQCEPTRVCESFTVSLAPALPAKKIDLLAGTALERVRECFRAVKAVAKQAPTGLQQMTDAQLLEACCQYKKIVYEFLAGRCLTHCEMPQITCPPVPSGGGFPGGGPNPVYLAVVQTTIAQLTTLLNQYLKDCICLALLPTCPADPGDPRVILACVTVKGETCQIVDICNLRGRQQVVTWPAVLYWSSTGPVIRRSLEKRCCEDKIGQVFSIGAPAPQDALDLVRYFRELVAPELESLAGQVLTDLATELAS